MLVLVAACNKNLTEDEKKELWSKAQTTGEIINRSGTAKSSALDKRAALRDAETRLSTGGGLFGNDGFTLLGGKENNNRGEYASVGIFF